MTLTTTKFESKEEVLKYLNEVYDPWITPVLEEYCSVSNDIQLDEVNHWVESEILIMENEYEQWINDTYITPGR
jgi:hypothetical protein